MEIQPAEAESNHVVTEGHAQVHPHGGHGGKGLLRGPEEEGVAECPGEPEPGCPAQHLPLYHRRCGPGGSCLQGSGGGQGWEGVLQVAAEALPAFGSGVPSSLQPATLLFLENGWASLAHTRTRGV